MEGCAVSTVYGSFTILLYVGCWRLTQSIMACGRNEVIWGCWCIHRQAYATKLRAAMQVLYTDRLFCCMLIDVQDVPLTHTSQGGTGARVRPADFTFNAWKLDAGSDAHHTPYRTVPDSSQFASHHRAQCKQHTSYRIPYCRIAIKWRRRRRHWGDVLLQTHDPWTVMDSIPLPLHVKKSLIKHAPRRACG